MVTEYAARPEAEVLPEQRYLAERMAEIEKGMGKVAARVSGATQLTQPMDALDRARELVGDLHKQIRLRSLEEAVEAQLAWLERAEARQATSGGEPKVAFNRIALDRTLLTEIREGWRARRN